MFLYLRSDAGKRLGEGDNVRVFCAFPNLAKFRVVAVLLATFGVAARSLDIPSTGLANPSISPSGRYREGLDAAQDVFSTDLQPIRSHVDKAVADVPAPQSRLGTET